MPAGKTAGQVVMQSLAAWTNAALASPDDPTSFAILFIAANNHLQAPKANLALPDQDPDLVRFSLLDLELLSAAIDRIATGEPAPRASGPCGVASQTYGNWDQVVKIGTNEASDFVVGKFLSELVGDASAAGAQLALGIVKIGTKIWKTAQMFRYGTLNVTIDTEDPTRKPLPSAAEKRGIDLMRFSRYQTPASDRTNHGRRYTSPVKTSSLT